MVRFTFTFMDPIDYIFSIPVPAEKIDEEYVEERKETDTFGDEYAVTTCPQYCLQTFCLLIHIAKAKHHSQATSCSSSFRMKPFSADPVAR